MDNQANQEISVDQESKTWVRPFFTIWIGQALSLVGSRIGGFALVWWLTQESGGSATILAMASFIATIPGVVLGPFIGALVDRWNRRRVLLVADSVIAAFSALLALLSLLGYLQIWHVYILMFIRALGGTFHWAAMRASTSLMVPRSHLSRVAGMNQTLQGIMSILTPPLGALLMEVLVLHTIMAIDVVTAAFAIVPLFFIAIPQPDAPDQQKRTDRSAHSIPQMCARALFIFGNGLECFLFLSLRLLLTAL